MLKLKVKPTNGIPLPNFKNVLPHCDVFADDDYTKEEIKLMKEPKKIMGDDTFSLTATAVRVPVQGGHSESVNIEFENEFGIFRKFVRFFQKLQELLY